MPRAAIYARFSTELQNERSIDDQIDLCRAYALREGLEVAATFADHARSGASVIGREELLSLMERAKSHDFDVVVVEALDRLSRDMEDLAGIHKRLSFFGIEIRAVHEGVVNTTLVGLRGLVGQLYREDNAHKIRRGLVGRVRQGLSAGGAPYGYRPDPAQKGKLLIVDAEADVVRRIFDEFVDGRSPRSPAHGLNRDRIIPPRGRAWNASTINGSAQRHNGLIRNELYAGKLVWNKVRMVKDPDTGRRVSRPNPKEQWQSGDVPELAIVEKDVFEAAQARKRSGNGRRPEAQRRPRRVLSGLLRCGCCGAGMSTNGKDSTGRVRIRCSAATESGTCPDPKTFYLEKVEALVLDTLAKELKHPAVLAEYIRAYVDERKRLAASSIAQKSSLERQHAECQREIERLVDAIAKGTMTPEDVGTKINDARKRREGISARLGETQPVDNVVTLHPAALAHYERQLRNLSDALQAGLVSGDQEGAEALRDLIATVTVYRAEDRPGGVRVEIAGRLNVLLGHKPPPGRLWGTVVAEERYRLSPQYPNLRYHLRSCA